MEPINGKVYPLWGQFVDRKDEWIGGALESFGAVVDRVNGKTSAITTIEDIIMEPKGTTSAIFKIVGKDFTCESDVKFLAIDTTKFPSPDKDFLTLHGEGGHIFRFKRNSRFI